MSSLELFLLLTKKMYSSQQGHPTFQLSWGNILENALKYDRMGKMGEAV